MPTSAIPNRAAIYLRLSQADDAPTSIARQRKDLRDLAEREGWAIRRRARGR